jgi:peptidoglycan hydrolase-like protein with peptidoglycan-binding domain
VRRFQREHRLDVDGLAGQQTQIIINSLLAVEGTPRLSTPRLAQE